jgi:hypothetical protein
MKNKILIFSLLTLFLIQCKSIKETVILKPTVKKIPEKEVVSAQKKQAYEGGKRVLNTCNTSKFKAFTTKEATQDLIQKMTADKISKTCQEIVRTFGKFQDLEFVEAIKINKTNEVIYRFKCVYEKKYYEKELQVYINNDSKISSIKTKNWEEEFVYNP